MSIITASNGMNVSSCLHFLPKDAAVPFMSKTLPSNCSIWMSALTSFLHNQYMSSTKNSVFTQDANHTLFLLRSFEHVACHGNISFFMRKQAFVSTNHQDVWTHIKHSEQTRMCFLVVTVFHDDISSRLCHQPISSTANPLMILCQKVIIHVKDNIQQSVTISAESCSHAHSQDWDRSSTAPVDCYGIFFFGGEAILDFWYLIIDQNQIWWIHWICQAQKPTGRHQKHVSMFLQSKLWVDFSAF